VRWRTSREIRHDNRSGSFIIMTSLEAPVEILRDDFDFATLPRQLGALS
jgi:hypothetical protein